MRDTDARQGDEDVAVTKSTHRIGADSQLVTVSVRADGAEPTDVTIADAVPETHALRVAGAAVETGGSDGPEATYSDGEVVVDQLIGSDGVRELVYQLDGPADRSLPRPTVERVEGEPFGVALGYTTGYPAALNALARGRHTARPIRAYAREYDVPLLPELDWHAPLPRTPSGFGVVDDEAFAALVEGEIPTADLLDSRVLKAGRWPGGVAWTDFVQTFPGAVPAPFRSFAGTATPTPDRLRAVRDRTTAELFAHSFWRRFCRSA
ncbi:hypothetical protein [Halorubrum sp. LN27]|uniref:hypothetical protein n=1 Tax=Halorubrum sp. LN27 TaxID=2801032 RepID=UPI00190D30C3|nr:hypothetical protein [Halorubrum sp. LN27]